MLRALPQHALTRAIGAAARLPLPRRLRRLVYAAFARRVGADLGEAALPLEDYRSFQEFFARRLRAGSRPIADAAVVAPVDGTVVSAGEVTRGQILQLKGQPYQLAELLGSAAAAHRFEGGRFVTLYLHPRNYHRIHAPIDGRVISVERLGGRLFPVSTEVVARVPRLFATNQRAVTMIEGAVGLVALVQVAALGVGTIDVFCRPDDRVSRGQEVATFLMGSTVVLVGEGGVALALPGDGVALRMGESLAPRS